MVFGAKPKKEGSFKPGDKRRILLLNSNFKKGDLPETCQYFVLSDHLDMVGVQLRATWTQTRKANGDIVQDRVTNTINPWRGGKFMALTMRPWSVNNYVLSKVWFRCGSVDLREGGISAINSEIMDVC